MGWKPGKVKCFTVLLLFAVNNCLMRMIMRTLPLSRNIRLKAMFETWKMLRKIEM